MNFIGRAISLVPLLKAYHVSDTKEFFFYEWFDCTLKQEVPAAPIYIAPFNQLSIHNLLEANYKHLQCGF